ncbi:MULTISPECIES: 3'-5' exonuclease [unclassified Oleiphilus]|uniref:3'-5' exonuclease n=1 Tax=unclassified Oleiphilus TaxID=2631174 RepID=UPI0007C2A5D4|nr:MULTISPECIES: 3'-5' exonuclease [unclassified Oleiphilus]KZY42802.1 hypothetical protein A3732_15670 [Oleiphilus sp. HI0050]KZY75754.1 hypothetical protein A3740_14545 [Oleiphilus sp. HI0068]KZY80138.1 hypothetical protein A3741_05950 [Oleiphilus sp. HI0069]KZZ31958.1 hypothetical protein A3756_06305 [Oleiphilus sp. HI0086]KZZ35109.1 hypothetical protein A3757_02860 [Oleiphilus sp. HI0117]
MKYEDFDLNLLDSDYLILDVEATGLGNNDQIIELSIIDKNGQVVFDKLIKATVPITDSAFAVHGISEGELGDKPLWNDVMEEVYALINGRIVFMYNARFDAEILVRSFETFNYPIPSFSAVCVAEWYANYFGARVRYRDKKAAQSLENAAKQQGIERVGNAHRALSDANLTFDLLTIVAEQQKLYMS